MKRQRTLNHYLEVNPTPKTKRFKMERKIVPLLFKKINNINVRDGWYTICTEDGRRVKIPIPLTFLLFDSSQNTTYQETEPEPETIPIIYPHVDDIIDITNLNTVDILDWLKGFKKCIFNAILRYKMECNRVGEISSRFKKHRKCIMIGNINYDDECKCIKSLINGTCCCDCNLIVKKYLYFFRCINLYSFLKYWHESIDYKRFVKLNEILEDKKIPKCLSKQILITFIKNFIYQKENYTKCVCNVGNCCIKGKHDLGPCSDLITILNLNLNNLPVKEQGFKLIMD